MALQAVAERRREDGDASISGVVEVAQHQSTRSTAAHERLDARVACRSPRQPRLRRSAGRARSEFFLHGMYELFSTTHAVNE